MKPEDVIKPEDLSALGEVLACPSCHAGLSPAGQGLVCNACGLAFPVNDHGYLEFRVEDPDAGPPEEVVYEQDTTGQEYVDTQLYCGLRLFDEYLSPLFKEESFETVLDAGCGMGMGISKLMEQGYQAYGIDLPNMAEYWAQTGKDVRRFFCADAARLPFRDGIFDVVYCMGAIEHIGTRVGYFTLRDDYQEIRQRCADELLRVTRPAGRVIVACPNKRFPVDIQHPPGDEVSRPSLVLKLRTAIYNRTGANIHPVWGRYHLLSYPEMRTLFCENGGARGFRPLPLRDYFGFSMFEKPALKPLLGLAKFYLNHLPSFLRGSFLNPYMLVEIRK